MSRLATMDKPAVDEDLYLVMPVTPVDGQHVWEASSFTYNGFTNVYGAPGPPPPKAYVFLKGRQAALGKARELSKQHGEPYYLARVTIEGRYIPPPPQFEPVFDSPWVKP